jgi:hypothetical protein
MLRDYKPQLDTPKRQGRLSLVYIQATFASGVATVDTDASSPEVTMEKDSTGDYDITFPKARFVHCIGVEIDPGTDDPGDTAEKEGSPRSLSASGSNGVGTGKILFRNSDDGGLADPEDNSRVYVTLLVGN